LFAKILMRFTSRKTNIPRTQAKEQTGIRLRSPSYGATRPASGILPPLSP
jgi:hypothetical protein